MDRYYKMLFAGADGFGAAYAPDRSDDAFFLPYSGVVGEWSTIKLNLSRGSFPDYLGSDLGCRLCSESLMRILQTMASDSDDLQWLDVLVRADNESRHYFILHFPNPPDVINKTLSILADDFVVKPVLSRQATSGHRVFGFPGGGNLPLFVSQRVKEAIESARCTNIEFLEVRAD